MSVVPRSGGGVVALVLMSVVMFSLGFFIVSRIRPLWNLLAPSASQ